MTFHIAHLKREEIANGILFRIGDIIEEAFNLSSKAVLEEGKRGGARENMLILFENSSTSDDFWDKVDENIQDILYLNDAAKSVIDLSDLGLAYHGTTDKPPESSGTMIHLPRFVNFT